MASWRRIGSLIAAAHAAACASAPPPPIVPPTDLSQLEGEWVGEYSCTSTCRVGIVAFRLEANPDAAWGQAWMTSRQWGYPDIALPRDLPSSNLVPTLSIRFTRAVGVLIQGRIEVRADPEMEWPIVMTFTGRAQGDVMQGTFIEDDPSTGTWIAGVWKVERTRFSAPKAAETAASSAHPFEDPLPTPRYADH